MRILVTLVMLLAMSGCTALLVGGSAETGKQDECAKSEKEGEESGCK